MVPPIDLSTLYNKTDTRLPNSGKEFIYTRINNLTRASLERNIAAIHQTEHAIPLNNIFGAYFSFALMFEAPKEIICISSR